MGTFGKMVCAFFVGASLSIFLLAAIFCTDKEAYVFGKVEQVRLLKSALSDNTLLFINMEINQNGTPKNLTVFSHNPPKKLVDLACKLRDSEVISVKYHEHKTGNCYKYRIIAINSTEGNYP